MRAPQRYVPVDQDANPTHVPFAERRSQMLTPDPPTPSYDPEDCTLYELLRAGFTFRTTHGEVVDDEGYVRVTGPDGVLYWYRPDEGLI